MTITLTIGGTAATLCHGPARSTAGNAVGPEGLSLRRSPGILQRTYIGDADARNEHPGGDTVNGSFSVTRIYSSRDAADAGAAGLCAAAVGPGTLAFGSYLTLYSAVLTDIGITQRGRSVRATYAFTGALTQET